MQHFKRGVPWNPRNLPHEPDPVLVKHYILTLLPNYTYYLYTCAQRKNTETDMNEMESRITTLRDQFTASTNFLTEIEGARNLKQDAAIQKVLVH